MRADKSGPHRVQFEKNKQVILRTSNNCSICGKRVDKNLKYPDPLCAVIDHIIPVSKGGHPSSIDNLALAHHSCNRQKSDKVFLKKDEFEKIDKNRNLPKSRDWLTYSSV